MSVDHYENFPVASWLCPPTLRPAIRDIYRFARTADDLADEGDATVGERLAQLRRFGADLQSACRQEATATGWPQVFEPLARTIERHRLPCEPMFALLSAFEQDLTVHRYGDRPALLDYCSRSANPVGRLLLHLYGIDDASARSRSDDICTALQLINFWQDLGVDARRGRVYLPAADCRRHGFDPDGLVAACQDRGRPIEPALAAAAAAAVLDVCDWAERLMRRGAPLVHQVPGRAGWELRGVVQGGLRIAEKIRRLAGRTVDRRPRLGAWDVPLLVGRALMMRPAVTAAAARA